MLITFVLSPLIDHGALDVLKKRTWDSKAQEFIKKRSKIEQAATWAAGMSVMKLKAKLGLVDPRLSLYLLQPYEDVHLTAE